MSPDEIAQQRAAIAGIAWNEVPFLARPTIRGYVAMWSHALDTVEHLQQVQTQAHAELSKAVETVLASQDRVVAKGA